MEMELVFEARMTSGRRMRSRSRNSADLISNFSVAASMAKSQSRRASRSSVDAMRARAQGAIRVQCVVQTTGVCTNIRIVRSFNPPFGLDQEAIKAAGQWRFRPGTRRGQPVPVVVTMDIEFALR